MPIPISIPRRSLDACVLPRETLITFHDTLHKSVSHRRFAVQDRRFSGGGTDGYDIYSQFAASCLFPHNLPEAKHQCAPAMHRIDFGLDRLEEYYVAFKEKRSIHAEVQFEVESFKNAFPDICDQIGMRDWGPFTIPVDPYFPELVWEFYASYKARQWLLKHKDRTETLPCLPSADNVITLATKTNKDAPAMK
ncbi:hypothetical protein HAX54_043361 [Datura stramonium]|uniref:Uncharacterized protein n=1 Tax=Datura stramonium TaxID=4076 RepID=A0ABS8W0Y0_DATST|nr:hypothetical protein [Datura stramonium]